MLKSIISLVMVFCFGATALAAEKNASTEPEQGAPANNKAIQTPDSTNMPDAQRVLTCRYYTVSLPDDWKALMPPTENQGMTRAIFAKAAGSSVVTMVVAPRGVADAKTIAGMFAEQFKADKPPVEKNGQYTFTFTRQGIPSQAWVATDGDVFMVTTITGNRKEAQTFLKERVKSAEYGKLLLR